MTVCCTTYSRSPVAATAGVGPSRYTVAEGETLRSIARTMLGDERMWYLIADANGLSGSELVKGQSLVIPSAPLHANAVDTFKPYDPSQITGDLSPALPAPGDMGGCGAVGQIVLVIVAVVVTIYTAGAASQFLLVAAGTGSASTFSAGLTALKVAMALAASLPA